MSSGKWIEARRIFEGALELLPEERQAHVQAASEHDADLACLASELLQAHESSSSRLEPPSGSEQGALEALAAALPGTLAIPGAPERIASYRLLRSVGSGGMGTVYEAEQDDPRRRVALKVMRHGLASELAKRRFRFESDVLARLQHANVARVLEAGVHRLPDQSELPWFALEFVPGASTFIEYVRRPEFSLRARIELFLQVCAGVEHGHQKGIIHRDLKATNILVGPDGVPKLIDFGIASVTGERALDATRLTLAGEIVGTLGAMSPEQLAGSSDDVDVRSDVYSLGALLFETLAGEPAFDLADTPLPQAIARVREGEPRRLGDISRDLPRELEWIVQRAMRPKSGDRYATASELGADLERFLGDLPVLAGPPTAAYHVGKFVRRHRLVVAAATSLLLVLLIALVWITAVYSVADAERKKFEAVNNFMTAALSSAEPDEDGPDTRLVDVLDDAFELSARMFAGEPGIRATLLYTVGRIFAGLGEYERATKHLEESVRLFRSDQGPGSLEAYVALEQLGLSLVGSELDTERAIHVLREAIAGQREHSDAGEGSGLNATSALGLALSRTNESEEAELHLRASYSSSKAAGSAKAEITANCASRLSRFLFLTGEFEEAEALAREVILIRASQAGHSKVDLLGARHNLAGILLARGRADEGLSLMREVHEGTLALFGPARSRSVRSANVLGQILIGSGAHREARDWFLSTLEGARKHLGEQHPMTLDARLGLGTSSYFLGDMSTAEAELQLAIEGYSEAFGEFDERILAVRHNLAAMLLATGRFEEAEEAGWINLEARRERHGDLHPDTLRSLNSLGFLMLKQGRFDEAEELCMEAWEGTQEVLGLDHPETLVAASNLADLYLKQRRVEDSIPLWKVVAEHGPRVFGEDSPKLLYARGGLAAALKAREK